VSANQKERAVMKTPKHHRGILARGAAVALSALALAGCMQQPIARPVDPSFAAASTEAQTDLYFQPGSSHLANGEVHRLRTFLAGLALRPTDDIIVDVPSSGIPTVDVRRAQVARNAVGHVPARVKLARHYGFATTEARPNAGFVQVIRYDRISVDCKNLGLSRNELLYNAPIPPMGCANAINLGNMAAEKRDLVAPTTLGQMDAHSSVTAIERYRLGETRPAPFGLDLSIN
jgi:type IV pilus biogenesis protein CpaD/CtpE